MRQTPAPTAPISSPSTLPLTPDHEQRLLRCLRSPSGQAVMMTLARNEGGPMSARYLAAAAYVSTTSARDHGFRAAQLGFAVQGTRPAGNGPPATTWEVTERGRDFVAELLAAGGGS